MSDKFKKILKIIMISVGKRVSLVKIMYRTFQYQRRRLSYLYLTKKTPLATKTVLFSSYRGRSYSCNPKALYRFLLSDDVEMGILYELHDARRVR